MNFKTYKKLYTGINKFRKVSLKNYCGFSSGEEGTQKYLKMAIYIYNILPRKPNIIDTVSICGCSPEVRFFVDGNYVKVWVRGEKVQVYSGNINNPSLTIIKSNLEELNRIIEETP